MAKNVYEILEEFEKAETRHDQLCVLRFNANFALRSVLQGMFDPRVEFVFTEAPPYTAGVIPPGMSYSSIAAEMKRAYIFEKNNPKVAPGLTFDRKRQILIQILETLEAKEAKVFMNMLLKRNETKNLTYDIVKEAFPDLLP